MKIVATQRMRRDTRANWESNNPIIPNGVLAYETDTNQIKVGDGESTYTTLDYVATEPPEQEVKWVTYPESGSAAGEPGDIAKSDTHLAVYAGDGTTHKWLTFMGPIPPISVADATARKDTETYSSLDPAVTPYVGMRVKETETGNIYILDGSDVTDDEDWNPDHIETFESIELLYASRAELDAKNAGATPQLPGELAILSDEDTLQVRRSNGDVVTFQAGGGGGGGGFALHDVTNAQRLAGTQGDDTTPIVAGDRVRVTDQGNRIEQYIGDGSGFTNEYWLVLKNTVEVTATNMSFGGWTVEGVALGPEESHTFWTDPTTPIACTSPSSENIQWGAINSKGVKDVWVSGGGEPSYSTPKPVVLGTAHILLQYPLSDRAIVTIDRW